MGHLQEGYNFLYVLIGLGIAFFLALPAIASFLQKRDLAVFNNKVEKHLEQYTSELQKVKEDFSLNLKSQVEVVEALDEKSREIIQEQLKLKGKMESKISEIEHILRLAGKWLTLQSQITNTTSLPTMLAFMQEVLRSKQEIDNTSAHLLVNLYLYFYLISTELDFTDENEKQLRGFVTDDMNTFFRDVSQFEVSESDPPKSISGKQILMDQPAANSKSQKLKEAMNWMKPILEKF